MKRARPSKKVWCSGLGLCLEMSLVFDFGQGLRCGLSIRHCRCHWIMAAWFVFLHFFLLPLCWYAVSERQMLQFFAGGLVGVEKHLFQRLYYICTELYFRSTTRQCRCYSKPKITKYCLKHEGNLIHGKTKRPQPCFISRWRVFYKCVQLVQGEIMLISITIILFNFEKKNISYVFLFLRNFKISLPSVLLFTLFSFREKNGEKTLKLTSINFVYMRLPDFATHCANRHGALHPRSLVWSRTTPLYQNISM